MNELENIANNTNGEIPNVKYEILRVVNVDEPNQVLADLKQVLTVFLENKDLSHLDEAWYDLLPARIVEFTQQLSEQDYFNDDLISHISTIIHGLKTIKDWNWYSSKITETGFDVYLTGTFHGPSIHLIHHLGIPHNSIFFISSEEKLSIGGQMMC